MSNTNNLHGGAICLLAMLCINGIYTSNKEVGDIYRKREEWWRPVSFLALESRSVHRSITLVSMDFERTTHSSTHFPFSMWGGIYMKGYLKIYRETCLEEIVLKTYFWGESWKLLKSFSKCIPQIVYFISSTIKIS